MRLLSARPARRATGVHLHSPSSHPVGQTRLVAPHRRHAVEEREISVCAAARPVSFD
jgi:hypothetical protein